MSFGKKYLINQNPLLNLKQSNDNIDQSTTSVASTSSLSDAQRDVRRAADLSFMLRNYKQAATMYDSVRREAQSAKKWSVTASAQQWSLIAGFLADPSKAKMPLRDLDLIIQQLVLSAEYWICALQLVSLLKETNQPGQIIFALCSRIAQTNIPHVFHLHLLHSQITIGLSLGNAKRRLCCLLFERFGSYCEALEIPRLALRSYQMAVERFQDQDSKYLDFLTRRVITLCENTGTELSPRILDAVIPILHQLRPSEMRLALLALQTRIDASCLFEINEVVIDGEPRSKYQFTARDLESSKRACDQLWNRSSNRVDPLAMLQDSQVCVKQVGETAMITIQVRSNLSFPAQLDKITLISVNGESYHCNSLTVHPGKHVSLAFMVSSSGLFKMAELQFALFDVNLKIPFGRKGFRLCHSKCHPPKYSEDGSIDILFKPKSDFWTPRFDPIRGSMKSFAAHQELYLELEILVGSSKSFLIYLLDSNLLPVDLKIESDKFGTFVKVKADSCAKVLFKYGLGKTGNYSFVLAVICDLEPRLVKVSLNASEVIIMSDVSLNGIEGPFGVLLSTSLLNSTEKAVKVYSAHLEKEDGTHLAPLGLESFEIRPGIPFSVPFYLENLQKPIKKLVLRLHDTRILIFEIPTFPSSRKSAIFSSGQVEIGSDLLATVVDYEGDLSPQGGTVILGEIRKAKGQKQATLLGFQNPLVQLDGGQDYPLILQ